jgi:formylglycine-generating enzyme required for sulfatase activity
MEAEPLGDRTQYCSLSAPLVMSTLTRQKYSKTIYTFTEDLGKQVSMDLVLIPSGTFKMGAPEGELGSRDNERPQYFVTVPAFFMGTTPITQAQWQQVANLPKIKQNLKLAPSHFKGKDLPVEHVSWHDATEFCQRLSRYTQREYRLPSESEWEYACRAGTTTPFNFGETIITDLANYRGNSSSSYGKGEKGINRQKTTPVKIFSPNSFGLYDMHGNVWEWCEDHYHNDYTGAPKDGSPWIDRNAESETGRVLRGGSWNFNPEHCRSAARNDLPDARSDLIGFRVVCCVPRT